MTQEEMMQIALGLKPGKIEEIREKPAYERPVEPVIPEADPELVKSYDGMMVPKNAHAIVLALRERVCKHIDKAYEMKKLCTCEDPWFDDCPACEVTYEHLNDAGIDTVRMFKVQAYQLPWELVRDALVYCLDR